MASEVLKSLGELTFEILPDMGKFGAQLTKGMSLAVGSSIGTLGALFEGLGKAMLKKFTLPLAIGAAANITQFQALDREIRSTITLLGTAPSVVNAVFDEFSSAIARVSTDVGGLERDIADGLYQAISAGVPRGDIGDFLNIAQMSAIADKTADMTTSVDGLTTVMNAFSSEGLSFAEIADIMFATVAKGKTTMGELSQSIGRAAGIANNAGVKFAEFQAIIGTLTLGGFKTAEAVSFLRAAITGLLRPGDEMNAVFEEIGFATAEAAIPVIGLQAAFQTVVDAAGGSTSKLQELIGTSEGVSAILGVTGANAEKFAGVLDATSNAAGFLANAFEIAEGGVGRSFGRMTEAFDRLGNRLGAIASQVAAPFVELITNIVNRVIGGFEKLAPVIDSIIDLLLGMAKAFEIPGLKALVAGLIVMAVVVGSLLGLIAPFLILLGALLKAAVLIRALFVVSVAWAKVNAIIGIGLKPIIAGYQKLLALLGTAFPRAVKSSSKAMVGFSGAVQKATLALSPIGLLGIIIAVTAVIAIAVFAYRKYKDSMESIRDQALLTTRGIDTMADSMGLVLEPIEKFIQLTKGGLTTEFVLKNTGVIQRIKDIQLALGGLARDDYVAGILLQFSDRGATPEELQRILDNLQAATNQTFGIKVDTVSAKDALDALNVQIDFIEPALREAADAFSVKVPRQLVPDLEEVADQLITIKNTQGPAAFIRALDQMQERFEGLPDAADKVVNEVFQKLEESADKKFGFDIGDPLPFNDPLLDFIDLREQLEEHVPGFFETLGGDVEVFDEDLQLLSVNTRKYLALVKSGGKDFLGPEALEVVGSLGDKLGEAFDRAKQAINDAFDVIEQRALSSVPFLSVFEINEIDVAGIIESAHLYEELLPQITALKEQFIKDTTPSGVEFYQNFLSMSAADQAGLAILNEADLNTIVQHELDKIGAAFDAAEAEKGFSAEGILGPIQIRLQEELQAVVDEAGLAGTAISTAVNDMLVEGGKEWVVTVAHWIQETGKALVSTEFGGTVSLGGPSIIATITINQNQVSVTSSSSGNAGTDVRRALQAAGRE